MKKNAKWIIAIFVFVLIATTGYSQTIEKIEKANSKKNVVFLAVTDGSKMLTEVKEMAFKRLKIIFNVQRFAAQERLAVILNDAALRFRKHLEQRAPNHIRPC